MNILIAELENAITMEVNLIANHGSQVVSSGCRMPAIRTQKLMLHVSRQAPMAATMNFSPFLDSLFVFCCIICGIWAPWLLDVEDSEGLPRTRVACVLATLNTWT